MKTTVTKCFGFEACHYLPNYEGACSKLHGHSYKLHVTVGGTVDKCTGMIIDFNVLKKVVDKEIISVFDHEYLNDFFDMPTAENMCKEFFKVLDRQFVKMGLCLESVKLWETESSYAECRR